MDSIPGFHLEEKGIMTKKQYCIDFAIFYIRDGGRFGDVAAILSVPPQRLYGQLKYGGYALKDLKKQPPLLQEERFAIITEMCKDAKKMKALQSVLESYGIDFEDFLTTPYARSPVFALQPPEPKKHVISQRNCEVAELRRQGKTLQSIGQQYGITRERVRQIVIKYNKYSDNPVDTVKIRELCCRVSSPERIARQKKVIELGRKGLTYQQISDTLGVEKKYIFQDVARYNRTVEQPLRVRREDNRKITEKVKESIVKERLKGTTNYVLAERFGISYGMICRVIKSAGLTRPRRNPKKVAKRVKTTKRTVKKKSRRSSQR